MKKRLIISIIISALILPVFNIQESLADFTDVFRLHENYEAINYLQENGIIEGYEDGTFKPEKKVNRAEFLKIVLEGSNITLDYSTPAPFTDIDNASWYAPYLKKAYAEGWIDGYPDGTFKPDQTINKVEALKIIGEVQEWTLPSAISTSLYSDTPLNSWYIKYVAYAKTNNLIEETSSMLYPDQPMTRANISEIIYRTLTYDPSSIDTIYESSTEELIERDSFYFTPEEYNEISNTFYDGITLENNIPNTFYKNEIFILKGITNSPTTDSVTVLIDPDDNNDYNYSTFTSKTDGRYFEIPVFFSNTGNYNIGILPGNYGQTKTTKISVLPGIPSSENTTSTPQTPTAPQINFEKDTTFIELDSSSETIKKIVFIQNDKKVNYFSRQDTNIIPIQYSDFRYFNEGEVSYYLEIAKLDSEMPLSISSDFTKSSTNKLNATTHTFSEISQDEIMTSPPDKITTISPITFSGTLHTTTQQEAFIIKPDGWIDKTDLDTLSSTTTYFGHTTIPSGSDFQFNYTPTSSGTYIIEIVDKNGLPILNHPVYIGNKIPLIPDYFDINKRDFFSGSVNLDTFREELLQLINQSRKQYGLNEVSLSEELNSLAQDHSDDMAERDFFAHINPDDETPDDRRLDAGIKTYVSENIAQDVSIPFAHYGLMRSATHRETILENDWTRVGIGITEDNGYLLITEEFSTSELTSENLNSYKEDLLYEINAKRTNNSLGELTKSTNIESASKYLNDKVIYDGVGLTNPLFQETLQKFNITGTSLAIGRTYNIWSDIKDSILEEETEIIENNWEKIGIDIQTDYQGVIHTILIINKQ